METKKFLISDVPDPKEFESECPDGLSVGVLLSNQQDGSTWRIIKSEYLSVINSISLEMEKVNYC